MRNKNNDTTTYETVLASIKCRCSWWIETEEMLKILNTTWEEFEKVASKVENKFIVRKEIKRANVALRNTDNNSNANPVAKTKPRNKNSKMMMQQHARLFAPDWGTSGLPNANNEGNEGDATKFNRSVIGTTEVNPLKETTIPKKGKQKSGARTK